MSEAVPLSATWGRAMPWWQGPTNTALAIPLRIILSNIARLLRRLVHQSLADNTSNFHRNLLHLLITDYLQSLWLPTDVSLITHRSVVNLISQIITYSEIIFMLNHGVNTGVGCLLEKDKHFLYVKLFFFQMQYNVSF